MGQVPASTSFLIIGNGRFARHLRHYFSLEKIQFQSWHRGQSPELLTNSLASATHVLLAISDRAITSFAESIASFEDKTLVHFSGSITVDGVSGAHPLMTFSNDLYDLETYRRIPFIVESEGPAFETLLPGLNNPWHAISRGQKPLYHALCALSGNFTVLLWEKVFADFSAKLGLPREVLVPYLCQITENIACSSEGGSALTGPLVRGDFETVERHLKALEGDAFRDVYAAFVTAYLRSPSRGPRIVEGVTP